MDYDHDLTPEDIKLFLEEADEQLQIIEGGLLVLEKQGYDGETLQELFRAAHTLKGSSATLGHQKMASLTHSMENVLDKLRKNQLKLNTQIIDVMFEGLDLLRELKEEIATGRETGRDITRVAEKLESIREAKPPSIKTGGSAVPAQGESLVKIDISLAENSPMPAVRAFQAILALEDMGKILRSEPTVAEIESEQVGSQVSVLLLTTCQIKEIRETLSSIPDIVGLQVEALEHRQEVEEVIQPQEAELPGSQTVSKRRTGRMVRVDVELLDNVMNLIGELVIDRSRLAQLVTRLTLEADTSNSVQELNRTSAHIGRITTQLQEEVMKARMLPLDNLFNKFPRMVRDLAQQAGKEINFIIEGQETELDRAVIDEIGDPLIHLLRNAVDHGIELPEERQSRGKPRKGTIRLAAHHEENNIVISVRDDGRGIDVDRVKRAAIAKGIITEAVAARLSSQEALNLIFTPGISTAEQVSEVSGRGVGMDVVRSNLDKVNGSIEILTEVGKGTEFIIKLPLTLAIIRGLLVELKGEIYVVPLSSVIEAIIVSEKELHRVNKQDAVMLRGRVLPLFRLEQLLGSDTNTDPRPHAERIFVVVVKAAGVQLGLIVDRLIGEQEVVVKSLGKFLGDIPGISGATILGEGDLALIIDVPSLVKFFMDLQKSA